MHWTHVSSSHGYMFVFSFLFLTSCAVSCFLFKCLCVSAVSHSQSSDGLGLSSSSILLELLQRAVVEGKKAESYLHHLRKSKFFPPKSFIIYFLPQVEEIQIITQMNESWIWITFEAFLTRCFLFLWFAFSCIYVFLLRVTCCWLLTCN